MGLQAWEELLNYPAPLPGAPLASSAALTDISLAPQLVLPANFLQLGRALRLTATGVFSTTGTPTITLGFYYGGIAGVSLADNGTTTTASSVTNLPWRLEAMCTVATIGTGGTIRTAGVLYLATSLTAFTVIPIPSVAQATVAIDTTAAKALTVGGKWSASSPSNTMTCNQFHAEILA